LPANKKEKEKEKKRGEKKVYISCPNSKPPPSFITYFRALCLSLSLSLALKLSTARVLLSTNSGRSPLRHFPRRVIEQSIGRRGPIRQVDRQTDIQVQVQQVQEEEAGREGKRLSASGE
jgi:hypothetical protein